MKKRLSKILVLILTLAFFVPYFTELYSMKAFAAAPAFSEKSIVITGEGKTYPLSIKNKIAGSKYSWSSTNTKVARITSKGLVTSMGKGSAYIKCKITYPSKKTTTLQCKVTVIIPATSIKINNTKLEKNIHKIYVGETYDFNRTLTPSNSTDKTYWYIDDDSDSGCISVNKANGLVTALKTGTAVLYAKAVQKGTVEQALSSIISDSVIIEVVERTATVKSAELVDSTLLKIEFDSPVDESTVIGKDKKLSENISILMKKNIKGVLAADPGNLTAELSTDKLTLTIKSTNMFSGEYGLYVSNKVKTTNGIALTEYNKQISFVDQVPPAYSGTTLDDSGLIATINFTEAMDFSSMVVKDANPVSTSTVKADPATISTLNNKLNYIPSEDKRSLTINLSGIAKADQNRSYTVILSGVKDLAGNIPSSAYITMYVYTDTTPKPQAKPISAERTGYNTITVTYDRGISYAGYLSVNGNSTVPGTIDPNNTKKVIYTITDSDAYLTGSQRVSVGFFNSFNVISSDYSANKMIDLPAVNFSYDKSTPVWTEEFDSETSILTLTFSRDVNVISSTGIIPARIKTITDDTKSQNVNYSIIPTSDKKILKFKLSNMTLFGTYTLTIPQGLIWDNYRNYNAAKDIVISNMSNASKELPGPYRAAQSTTNPSLIYLYFANKVDEASAENKSNYVIPGATILSAEVTDNSAETGATVLLTVQDGTIGVSIVMPITVSGVKGYNGSFTEISKYTLNADLKDNKKPTLVSTSFDTSTQRTIKLTFSEDITGTAAFRITLKDGVYNRELSNSVTVQGNTVFINLNETPPKNTYLQIDVISNNLMDSTGNIPTLEARSGVVVYY